MRQKYKHKPRTGRNILLVDDSREYLELTRKLLEREGHTVLTATNGAEALEIVKSKRVDLMLIDYFMPGMTGEDVVRQVRKSRPYLQVIIQTGYAGEQPPRELLKRLDIQGYYDKSEGPEKLLVWVDAGLKSAYFIELLYKSRQGLKYILNITPDLHKIQPLQDLLKGVLLQISGLLGVVHSFLAIVPEKSLPEKDPEPAADVLVILENDDANLIVKAATGRFSRMKKVDLEHLGMENIRGIREALNEGTIKVLGTGTAIPLLAGKTRIGIIYLDYPVTNSQELELIQIFAKQVAVAIQNARLYQMAPVDQSTGLVVREVFEEYLIREVRAAFRAGRELSVFMLELDEMKTISDTGGRPACEKALAMAGEILRETTRSTDIISRYGEDVFAAILPSANPEGAIAAASRILASLKDKKAKINGDFIPLKCSIRISTLPAYALPLDDVPRPFPASYFQEMAGLLVKKAGSELCRAKEKGGFQYSGPAVLAWLPIPREKNGD
ncbi:MAG: DUF3369 domain-containing protein [Firmicutes bacterium]|nr:DUF3369 domain-containing protein [Bacillota bacterium]